jgi:hypothetical protein
MRCLTGNLADKFLAMLRDGSITPEKLIGMTSAQRRTFFADFMGNENAQWANAMLEKKLILKNQQAGIVTWAKQVAGLTPEAERTLVARVNKMEEVLTPATEDAFLEDLAAHALGTAVTMEEAGNITALAQTVNAKKEAMEAGPRRETFETPTEAELEYGRAVGAFEGYVTTLKAAAAHETVGEWGGRKLAEYKENPFQVIGDSLGFIAATSREVKSSIDNSFIGRQGRNLFFKGITGNVTISKEGVKFDSRAGRAWIDTFRRSYGIIWETFKGKGDAVMGEIRAMIVSDPDYDTIRKAGVQLFVTEEETPSDLPSRIPYVGIPFEASRNAYNGSAQLLRYHTAKMYLYLARETGVDMSDKAQLEPIGRLANTLTGRGDVKGGPEPGFVDNAFFSRRLWKADFDTLTAHRFDKTSSFVRKEAGKNLLRIIVAQAIILAIADLIDDDSVTWDPRHTDFAKIKAGNTRFDIGGGMGAMVRLAARIGPTLLGLDAYTINSEGKKTKINKGDYKSLTGADILFDYIKNKTAPIASVILARLAGQYRFRDEKPSVLGDVRELYVPIPVETGIELLDDEESANFLLAMLLDAQGFAVNTYEPKKKTRK